MFIPSLNLYRELWFKCINGDTVEFWNEKDQVESMSFLKGSAWDHLVQGFRVLTNDDEIVYVVTPVKE